MLPIAANYGSDIDTVGNLMDAGFEYSIGSTSEFHTGYAY